MESGERLSKSDDGLAGAEQRNVRAPGFRICAQRSHLGDDVRLKYIATAGQARAAR